MFLLTFLLLAQVHIVEVGRNEILSNHFSIYHFISNKLKNGSSSMVKHHFHNVHRPIVHVINVSCNMHNKINLVNCFAINNTKRRVIQHTDHFWNSYYIFYNWSFFDVFKNRYQHLLIIFEIFKLPQVNILDILTCH